MEREGAYFVTVNNINQKLADAVAAAEDIFAAAPASGAKTATPKKKMNDAKAAAKVVAKEEKRAAKEQFEKVEKEEEGKLTQILLPKTLLPEISALFPPQVAKEICDLCIACEICRGKLDRHVPIFEGIDRTETYDDIIKKGLTWAVRINEMEAGGPDGSPFTLNNVKLISIDCRYHCSASYFNCLAGVLDVVISVPGHIGFMIGKDGIDVMGGGGNMMGGGGCSPGTGTGTGSEKTRPRIFNMAFEKTQHAGRGPGFHPSPPPP